MQMVDNILPENEYYKESVKKNMIIIHHTAGGHRPDWTIAGWNNDTLGRIATAYVIGGKSITDANSDYDGKIYRAFDDRYWGYHLGAGGKSLNARAVGIEVCNYGPLSLGKDGKFYNYVNKQVPQSDVCDLGYKFRGYRYWHSYTQKQIDSLKSLCLDIATRHGINLKYGLKQYISDPNDAFEFKNEALKGASGIWSHTSVRKDKTDMYPHPQLVQMINNF